MDSHIEKHGWLIKVSQSSTWESINLYELGLESNLNYTGNGEYGFDTVGLELPHSGGPTLEHQIVAGNYLLPIAYPSHNPIGYLPTLSPPSISILCSTLPCSNNAFHQFPTILAC